MNDSNLRVKINKRKKEIEKIKKTLKMLDQLEKDNGNKENKHE